MQGDDELRHGDWIKEEQRYEDGCLEDIRHTDETAMPYRYLISYTGFQAGRTVNGHVPLHRTHAFTSDVLGDVLDYLKERFELDDSPVILGVFTLADSADAR